MKKLSTALEDIKPTAEQLIESNDLSSTAAHGSITKVGKMNTLSTNNNKSLSQNTSEQNRLLVLRDDEEGQRKLSRLLLICFDVLDTFGKEADQLENINNAFQMFLEDYSYSQIERAFKLYMQNNTVLPKPADIIKIMEKPKVSTELTEGQREALEKLRRKYF